MAPAIVGLAMQALSAMSVGVLSSSRSGYRRYRFHLLSIYILITRRICCCNEIHY